MFLFLSWLKPQMSSKQSDESMWEQNIYSEIRTALCSPSLLALLLGVGGSLYLYASWQEVKSSQFFTGSQCLSAPLDGPPCECVCNVKIDIDSVSTQYLNISCRQSRLHGKHKISRTGGVTSRELSLGNSFLRNKLVWWDLRSHCISQVEPTLIKKK